MTLQHARRLDKLEAALAADEAVEGPSGLANAIVRARASTSRLRSEADVRKMAQQPGLLGRVGRARLQAGLYENSPADRARREQTRPKAEALPKSEATAP
jgi:hypothetical protein